MPVLAGGELKLADTRAECEALKELVEDNLIGEAQKQWTATPGQPPLAKVCDDLRDERQ